MLRKEAPSDSCLGIELQTPAAFTLELNQETVEGFCQAADVRLPIKVRGGILTREVVGQPNARPDKTDPPLVSVVKENENWIVRIDNNCLGREVRRRTKGDPKKFEAKYGQCFERALEQGLVYCLIKEKLANAERMTLPTLVSYGHLATFDLIAPALIFSKELRQVEPNFAAGLILALQFYGIGQSFAHLMNFSFSYTDEIFGLKMKNRGSRPKPKQLTDVIRDFSSGLTGVNFESSSLQDPFIRHRASEIIMPAVPVDKLLAGVLFLREHRNKLVELKFNLPSAGK